MVDEACSSALSRVGSQNHGSKGIDIVVVGAQKALSTSLATMLGQHPEVFMAPGEFHGFLDNEYAAGQSSKVFDLVAGVKEPLAGFKCASYLGEPEVARRLHEQLQGPHIVAGLRHPVERAVSAWYWWIKTGVLPPIDAEQGLAEALDGLGSPHAQRVLEWGRYARLLDRYREVFPPDRIHVVTDVEWRADPGRTLRQLYSAVGAEPSFVPDAFGKRYNAGTYSLARLRWLRLRQRFVWREDEDGVWHHARPQGLWPMAANVAVVGTDRVLLRHVLPNRPPALSPGLRRRMLEFYAEDTDRLERQLGRALGAWRS